MSDTLLPMLAPRLDSGKDDGEMTTATLPTTWLEKARGLAPVIEAPAGAGKGERRWPQPVFEAARDAGFYGCSYHGRSVGSRRSWKKRFPLRRRSHTRTAVRAGT